MNSIKTKQTQCKQQPAEPVFSKALKQYKIYKSEFTSFCSNNRSEMTTRFSDVLAIRGRENWYKNNPLNCTIKIVNVIHWETHKKLRNKKVSSKHNSNTNYIKKIMRNKL